jgi:hypothetical protein
MLPRLSIETLLATQEIINGGPLLEDRRHVRRDQDPSLLPARIVDPDSVGGIEVSGAHGFQYGSVDLLPYCEEGRRVFQVLEFNGCGTRGITNLPVNVLEALLQGFSGATAVLRGDSPLIAFVVNGPNRLRHERVLLAQALQEGLAQSHGQACLAHISDAMHPSERVRDDGPVVAIGSGDAMRRLTQAKDGTLRLLDRRVDAATHDIFCQHLVDRFNGGLAPGSFCPINMTYALSANKDRAYALYNAFLLDEAGRGEASSDLFRPVSYRVAANKDELSQVIATELATGRGLVLKPHAAGCARGIQFLLPPLQPSEVEARIERSLKEATAWQTPGGPFPRPAFPYVICDFVDSLTIQQPSHPYHGHKYELRFIVYRQGARLRVFPSICKVSGWRYEPSSPDDRALLNTVGLSGEIDSSKPNDHALPLCNARTLALIDLDADMLATLSDWVGRFVAFAIKTTQGAL